MKWDWRWKGWIARFSRKRRGILLALWKSFFVKRFERVAGRSRFGVEKYGVIEQFHPANQRRKISSYIVVFHHSTRRVSRVFVEKWTVRQTLNLCVVRRKR
jgi:hypothetical protein